MTFKTFVAAACVATVAAAAPAFAQAPAQTTTPQVTHGPAIAGVCVVSVEGAIGGSAVGQYVSTRLEQLVGQVNAELNGERTAIENESKSLESQRATLDRTTLETRVSNLNVRANALQRKAQLREREIAATEQKALGRVGQELEPLIRQVYQQRNCSVLVNRNAVVLANPAMDITPQLVTALNAKITQFAFDRERLDQAAAPAQTAPAQTQRR